MSYVKRMLQLPTSRAQLLAELAIIAALAFSLGMAANSIGRDMGLTTANDQVSVAVVDSEARNQPAVAARSASGLARVPYEAGWQLYDSGWAGGPNTLRGISSASAVVRVPYEAGWTLYDDGWAGGPATRHETSGAAAPARVPYEAGWTLYDDGWAGGPRTAPPTQTGH
jgi:hypothetical protein